MIDYTHIEDGGPAFPRPESEGLDGWWHDAQPGMSLRDWFASNERIDTEEEFGWELLEKLAGPRPSGDWKTNPIGWFDWHNRWLAKVRYARADAMLAARKGGSNE